MSNLSTADEKEQRLDAKNELGNFIALIVIEDEFLRAYVKRIFEEVLDLKNTIECTTPDEAKKYLDEHAGKKLACVASGIYFSDGTTGTDFLRLLRSSHNAVVAPFVLVGENTEGTIENICMEKYFAGHVGQSFTPAEFISMLLDIFSVRDNRREKRHHVSEESEAAPENDGHAFNRLYTG